MRGLRVLVGLVGLIPFLTVGSAAIPTRSGENVARPAQASEAEAPGVPGPAAKPQLQADYAKLPLHFEANRGQTDPEVDFLARGNGYTLFLSRGEAVLSLRRTEASAKEVPALRPLGSAPVTLPAHVDHAAPCRNIVKRRPWPSRDVRSIHREATG